VYWKGKVYQCIEQTKTIGHYDALQAGTVSNIPYPNVFPDDPQNGTNAWGIGVAYSVTGLYPNNVPADFTAWSSVTAYTTGNRVSYNNQIWRALASSTNIKPGADITNWQSEQWVLGDNRCQQLKKVYIDIALFEIHARIAPQNVPKLRTERYDGAIIWLTACMEGTLTPKLQLLQPTQGTTTRWGGNTKEINTY
jgi:hypothetical protein